MNTWTLLAVPISVLAAARAVSHLRPLVFARIAAWTLVLISAGAVHGLLLHAPAPVRMLLLVWVVFYAMKAVVTVEARPLDLTPGQWLCFAGVWPGMRPHLFEALGNSPRVGIKKIAREGFSFLLLGMTSLAAAIALRPSASVAASLLLLTGLSFNVHFGLFSLLAAFWRQLGVDCRPLFRASWKSCGLREFWGKRWNLAYSEMIAQTVYRPILQRWGQPAAHYASFLASGLLHEVAITLPLQRGYGGPTLYFLLHGFLTSREEASLLPKSEAARRLRVALWLLLPLPLLFPPAFIDQVLWPLLAPDFLLLTSS